MSNYNAKLESCLRCGSMFFYSGFGKCICAKCKEEDDAQFTLVKDYIYANHTATLKDVAAETGVSIGRIKSFLRDGRLVIPDQSAVFIDCEVCGTKIKFGRVCRNCAESMNNEIKAAMNINEFSIGDKPNHENSSGRMRFLDSK